MATTGADVLIQTLLDWGVDIIFGLPGDGIDGIMESLRKYRNQMRFLQVRHEEAVRFAESLARGEPRRMHIATTILEDKVKELV